MCDTCDTYIRIEVPIQTSVNKTIVGQVTQTFCDCKIILEWIRKKYVEGGCDTNSFCSEKEHWLNFEDRSEILGPAKLGENADLMEEVLLLNKMATIGRVFNTFFGVFFVFFLKICRENSSFSKI